MRYEIVASRGRWINNRWTQQYEMRGGEGITNTLTGVEKDNLVLEIYGCATDKEAQNRAGKTP